MPKIGSHSSVHPARSTVVAQAANKPSRPPRAKTDKADAPVAPAAPKLSREAQKLADATATTAGAIALAQKHPKDEAAMLAAIATNEETLKYAHASLRKSPAFLKKAALANPVVVLPELQNEYGRFAMDSIVDDSTRRVLLRDPEVKAAVTAFQKRLAACPDLKGELFDNKRFLATVIDNRLSPKANDPRPVAVVVYPKQDWNGQFFGNLGEMEALTKAHRVMFFQVGTDAEFASAMKAGTAGKPAELVFVGGHGEPTLTAFGEDDPARLPPALRKKLESAKLSEKDRAKLSETLAEVNEEKYLDFSDRDLLAPLKDRLAKGGNVVLMSCSTGKGGAKSQNLANFLHQVFPQGRIHAPTEPVPNSGVVLDEAGRFLRAGFADVGKAYVVGG